MSHTFYFVNSFVALEYEAEIPRLGVLLQMANASNEFSLCQVLVSVYVA